MTTALLHSRPALLSGHPGERAVRGRPPTLEERLEGAWRTAHSRGVAECPVCRSTMRPGGAGARCGGCGSVLS